MSTVSECLDRHYSGKNVRDGTYAQYGIIYERHFAPIKNDPIRVLELGVAYGASVRAWRDYFSKAEIIGFDQFAGVDGARVLEDVGNELKGRGRLFRFDQASRESTIKAINKARGVFDVIIDDCSHYDRDQQLSLGILFPKLKCGGLYFIEDVGVSPLTRMVADKFLATKKFSSPYITSEENNYLIAHATSTWETPTLLLFKKI